jgi:hypothetical protein
VDAAAVHPVHVDVDLDPTHPANLTNPKDEQNDGPSPATTMHPLIGGSGRRRVREAGYQT